MIDLTREFAKDRGPATFMNNVKPTILFCLAVLTLPLGAKPERLSPIDAELLLKKLKDLQEGSNKRIQARYKTAHSAFRSAASSDSAAHDLYLKCIEKVQFEDEKKKASAFRDWKRRHKERGDSPEFRRALRHQLSWLLLTLEAASEPEKIPALGTKALERIDRIFQDAKALEGEEGRLRRSVLSSVYASAYGIGGLQLENWPTSPLNLDEVYEDLILPPLRKPTKIEELRKAWQKRILHEGSVHTEFGRRRKGLVDRQDNPVELDRFLVETRPQMTWDMEVDLFKAGDQKGAAVRMLGHIEKFNSHKSSPEWIADFRSLVEGPSGKKKPATTTTAD